MKVGELIGFSRRRLDGRRREIFFVCAVPLGAELLIRAAELAIYSLILHFGGAQPAELFTGDVPELLGAAAVFAFLRLTVIPPLRAAAALRLRAFTEDEPCPKLTGRLIRRSVTAALTGRIISAVTLVPAVISAYIAAELISAGAGSRELLAASSALAISGCSALMWVSVRLGLAAVPWMLAERPDRGGIAAVFRALRFTRGRRDIPVKLGAAYLFPAVTVVGIPFVIPELAAAYFQALSICMKEDEYARETNIRFAGAEC